MTARRGYVRSAAIVSDWPAYCFARVLRRHLPELLDCLDPSLRGPVEQALADVTLAGADYARGVCGSAEVPPASAPVSLDEMDATMTTDEAACLLDCSSRWVRTLAEAGTLPGPMEHKRWVLDAAAVRAYGDSRKLEVA